MEIIQINQENREFVVDQAALALATGKLVVYPTETCYGLGSDATSREAISRVLRYKSKRADKPLSIAVCDEKMAGEYAVLNDMALNLMRHFLPGPITVVCKGKNKVAQGVESCSGTIGIRVPAYPLVLDIVKRFGKPITATSANVSYKKTPYCLDDVLKNISKRQESLLGLLLDAGELPKRKPSSVVDTTLEGIHVLREGDILLEGGESFVSSSEEETSRFAGKIFSQVEKNIGKKSIVFELYGELGAGKTCFTRFFARHLGIQSPVVSPTFILCNEYPIEWGGMSIRVYHMDAYRMYSPMEMDDLGMENMFSSPNLVFIEWANKVSDYIAPRLNGAVVVKIKLEHVSPTTRKMEYTITSS